MTITEALRLGIRAIFIRKRMWLLFYALTTIWAAAAVAPVMALLFALLGQSAWAARMAANFDLQFIAELIFGKGPLALNTLMVSAVAVFIVAAVAHLFLLGGAIQLFCGREPFSFTTFFHGCGRHFWRFVRLALVSAPFYVVVVIASRALNGLGNKIWGEGSVETPLIYWGWFRTALVLALLGLVNLAFDYARIRLVSDDSRKAIRGAMAAVRLVFQNFRRTAGLYVAVWMILVVILVAYRGMAGLLAQPTLGIVFVLFLVRQVTVLGRIGVQLLFYSSQSELYLALVPPPVVAAEPLVETTAEPSDPDITIELPIIPVAPPPEPFAEETSTTPEPER